MNVRVAAMAALISLASPLRAGAEPATDLLPVHGTVVSIDAHGHTIVLRYTTAGSNPAKTRHYYIEDAAELSQLRRGAVIDGTANTTKTPWTLTHINVESLHALHGHPGE